MKELGIYIHIPFCKKKCYYCDFISFENKEEKIENYIKALKREIVETAKELENENYSINTIYIGGRNSFFYRWKIYTKNYRHNKK